MRAVGRPTPSPSSGASTSSSTTRAVASTKPIAAWTPEEWHQVVDLNLGSVWFLSRFAAEPMLAQGKGAIVNISSGSSLFAFPIGAPYGASKAAVNNLTASMAAAWTPKGVRVNALAVGAVRTEMLLEDGKKYGLDEAALGAGNAMGRIGEPDEIGYAVLYFASDASSYCSGQTLWINGGPKAAGGIDPPPRRGAHDERRRV